MSSSFLKSFFGFELNIDQFARGLLKLIPVAGNLGLGFLDGRIQINPQGPIAIS